MICSFITLTDPVRSDSVLDHNPSLAIFLFEMRRLGYPLSGSTARQFFEHFLSRRRVSPCSRPYNSWSRIRKLQVTQQGLKVRRSPNKVLLCIFEFSKLRKFLPAFKLRTSFEIISAGSPLFSRSSEPLCRVQVSTLGLWEIFLQVSSSRLNDLPPAQHVVGI